MHVTGLLRTVIAAALTLGATLPVARAETVPVPCGDWRWTVASEGAAVPPAADAKWKPGAFAWNAEDPTKGISVWIRGTFEVPSGCGADSHLATLEFPSVGGNLVVFANGTRVGERIGPFGFLELGDAFHGGTNDLLVYATSEYRDVSQTAAEDELRNAMKRSARDRYARRAGVCLDPVLHLTKRGGGVFDAWAETSWRERKLVVRVVAKGAARAFPVVVRDAGGRTVKKATLPAGADRVEIPWEDPVLWDIDKGYLYTCAVDDFAFSFGFREVWTEGKNVMINGHPLRLRVEMANWFPLTDEKLPLWRRLGLNAFYVQAHPNAWFRYWHEVPDYTGRFQKTDYGEMLAIADREGIAAMLPAVTATPLFDLADKPDAEKWWAKYREMNEYFLARTRRHPCVIASCVSMNLFNPKDAISPEAIGRRRRWEDYGANGGQWPLKARLVDEACKIVKSIDPTRLVYGHGEGCVGGDIATANNYQNLTPAQEVADYPEHWAAHGDMPYFACEFGTYDGSYFKDFKRCLLTEYDAIYLGPRAYAGETDAFRGKLIEAGLKNNGYGNSVEVIRDLSPAYDDLQGRFEEAAFTAWRSYGMFAWHHFIGGKYGVETNLNVHGRAQEKWMQPFLGYIGGGRDFADRTHVYRPGEKVEKSLVAIWDSGRGPLDVRADWHVVPPSGGRRGAGGAVHFALSPFEMTNHVFSFSAPAAGAWAVEAVFTQDGKETVSRFPFEVREMPTRVKTKRTVWLYDPKGESDWVRELVPAAKTLPSDGRGLRAGDILVVGRHAVDRDSAQPYAAEMVKSDLRVLFLEQAPANWDLFGLDRNADVFVRRAFFAVPKASGSLAALYDGLDESDLASWRGRPTLVPEYRYTRQNACGAPKGSGRHAIASTVFEIPSAVGYRPLFVCEFDLNYTPLLEWDWGCGCVIYSAFDFSGRVGTDVSATRLAANLFRYLDAVEPKAETPRDSVRLHVGLSSEELAKCGIRSESRTAFALPLEGELAGVLAPSLVRWRDKVTYAAIAEPGAEMGGVWYRKDGDCYLQIAPDQLDGRYKNEANGFRWTAINTSVERLRQLVARVRTHLGEEPSDDVVRVAAKSGSGGGMTEVAQWNLLGPYQGMRHYDVFKPGFEESHGLGEAVRAALAGDLNPNVDYVMSFNRTAQARDFRPQVAPDGDGVVAVGAKLYPEGQPELGQESFFAYAVGEVESAAAREAVVAMNVSGLALLFVNGERVVDMTDARFRTVGSEAVAGDPGRFRFRVRLKKGRNVLALKLANVPHRSTVPVAFSFRVSDAGYDLAKPYGAEPMKASVYDSSLHFGGAYGYHYW